MLLTKLGVKDDPDVIEKLLSMPADVLVKAGAGERFGEGIRFGPAADDIVIMRAKEPYSGLRQSESRVRSSLSLF